MLIEATRRESLAVVERLREVLVAYDKLVFADVQVDVPAESAISVVRDGRTYVLALNDPTLPDEPPELERDCGY